MKVATLVAMFVALTAVLSFHTSEATDEEKPLEGKLTGRVVDAATEEPLPGVGVVVVGTVLGTLTDLDGRFLLSLPAGTYTVEASMIGYKRAVRKGVVIAPGKVTRIQFELEEAVIRVQPVVVTASKRRQLIQESPVSIDVITSSELGREDVVTLDQALERVSGIDTKGGEVDVRGTTGYSQGAGSRVLFLIDGSPAIAGDTGTIKWDAIPPTVVDRVEVIKGAGSALYGSNALGGVINVITKKPGTPPETGIRLSSGFYSKPYYPEWRWTKKVLDFNGIELLHSRKLGGLGLLVSVGRRFSDGYRQNDDYIRHNLFGKFTYNPSPEIDVELLSSWAEEDHGQFLLWKSQAEALKVSEKELGNRVYSNKLSINLSVRRLASPRRADTYKSYYYRTYWKNWFRDNRDYSRAQRTGGELRTELLISEGHSLGLGIEGIYNRVNSEMFGDHRTLDLGLYVQDEFRPFPRLTVTLGTRYDHHTVDETSGEAQLSPKTGLVWRPSDSVSLRTSLGRGFRAPSVAEMFVNTVVAGRKVIPNPKLRAERAWSYEIGANMMVGDRLWVDLAVFQNDFRRMIEPEAVLGGLFRLANLVKSRVRGTELTLKINLLRNLAATSFSYTYIDAVDLRLDEPLPYRPRHRLRATASLNHRGVRLGVDFKYHSRVEKVHEMFSADQRVAVYVVDLKGSLDLKEFTISAKVDNLLQYHYVEIPRRLEPIRSYTLTVAANF
ncbi:MAG TPA: TonB-dependent receptor [Candidatus Latescibacteria bacterium]|nr:TonB-dependent receptor [Candidatus Latescibacterota bacterium]